MTATTGNTLALLQSVQALILANTGSAFAALSAADAARYGVSRAVFVGAPKEYKDGYLPQCHIIPEADLVAVSGGASRVEDVVTCRVRVVVDFSDWWAAEQAVLAIRDQLLALFATHVRGGAAAGGAVVALDVDPKQRGGEFQTVQVAGVWYRSWSVLIEVEQVYVPSSGYQP
jgi:hypothetical protein